MRSKKPFSAGKPTFVTFITLLLASIVVPAQTQAQKFKVLHTFHGSDGATPVGVLVRDAAGNIYSTTGVGGAGNCNGGLGCGTAFKMNKAGKLLWSHNFKVTNGDTPAAGLLRDAAGNLFGTTLYGGNTNCNAPYGCGTVFRLSKTGKESVLHKFTGTPDGYFPESLLARDKAGNLYLTTYIGGNLGLGAVFKMDTTGKETLLYSFSGGSDGCFPKPGVISDAAGNLYGVAVQGGAGFCNSGYGVVFKVDTSGNETVLYTLSGGSDGAYPGSVLLFDAQGNLYGTTRNGGIGCGTGCGVVFELSPQSGGGWSETVLYEFCSLSNCADGESPGSGPLVRDSAGNLYGTTFFGGTSTRCNGTCGVVFKLDNTGKETVLHSFTGGSDGAIPEAGLSVDSSGNLYGTTYGGGDLNCHPKYGGCGVVFKITP
jgi:uncharacterized repeat protein (TIGR03803 family)